MSNQTQERRIIGLDAHPYLFSAVALSGANPLVAKTEWVLDRVSLDNLEKTLRKRLRPQDIVVLEASGNSFSVAERLAVLGVTVHVLDSQTVSRVGSQYCVTDRTDAVKLARVFLSGLAKIVWTPDARCKERRELFFAHRNAVRDAVRLRNRFWAWCNEQGVRRTKGFRMSNPRAIDTVREWKEWTELQILIIEGMLEAFQEAEGRRVRLRARIAEEVMADPMILQLVRLLGVRHLIAFALMAFIDPIERFENPKKLVAYIGLNPRVNISGTRGGTGRLSHHGRSDLRALMIQAAQSVLRYGTGPTHQWAIALKMRKGATVAVAALARKIVVSVWYLLSGRFTLLKEVPQQLKIKIHKIASEIGAKRIRALGFKSMPAFEKQKLEELLVPV
ncbi:MAG: IS110 family transposase [Verrucomicrobiota bacterium]|jgi:transposase|nr:IS110 family transposase [Verrucomicrobiota bacterium]